MRETVFRTECFEISFRFQVRGKQRFWFGAFFSDPADLFLKDLL